MDSESSIPKPSDFKFLIISDSKARSRAAVELLATYAIDAARSFHQRNAAGSVESLVNARKFAEYLVTYVARQDGIPGVDSDENGNRLSFAGRVDSLKRSIADFPANELKRIWRNAGDAAHPPEGVTEQEISDYKRAYQVAAPHALRDALKIGIWFQIRYGKLSWFARLLLFFRRNRQR